MKVPFVDLTRQYQTVKDEVAKVTEEVMSSGRYVSGQRVEKFEQEFSSFCNSRHGIGVSNGADAIHIALLAMGVKKEDEVIIPANTFHTVLTAILACGAKPVLADINEKTYTLDMKDLKRKITKKTKVIVPTHLYGQMAGMEEIKEIAGDIMILEDASQAHGAERNGRRAGSIGTTACFSLYPAKNLGAFGEAGIITTSDPEIAEKAKIIRNCGQKERYQH